MGLSCLRNALQGMPACSECVEVGGTPRVMQREPPTNPLPRPETPSPLVELPLSKSRAYEWSEYNKRHFFLHSLPLAGPSLPL